MKYLVLLAIVFVVFWWFRHFRSGPNSPNHKKNKSTNTMLACYHCGLHVPQSEVVFGKRLTNGSPTPYCSQQHLQHHEEP